MKNLEKILKDSKKFDNALDQISGIACETFRDTCKERREAMNCLARILLLMNTSSVYIASHIEFKEPIKVIGFDEREGDRGMFDATIEYLDWDLPTPVVVGDYDIDITFLSAESLSKIEKALKTAKWNVLHKDSDDYEEEFQVLSYEEYEKTTH